MTPELEQRVLRAARFTSGRLAARAQVVHQAMPAIETSFQEPNEDWSFLITAASLLLDSPSEGAQSAVLEIAQACLTARESTDSQRAAAVVLLERLGNRRAVDLAVRREVVERDAWLGSGAGALDVARSRLELSVPTVGGDLLQVNPFQRRFWTAAQQNTWISISAPTAAGKSYIVRRWIEQQLSEADDFTAVLVVPTRALIEEVSHDLETELSPVAKVRTLPWDAEIGDSPKEIFVLTQERLHLLLHRFPELAMNLVFVDEAQKFDDGSRGVLLQQVLTELVSRSQESQILFASPLSENPELLVEQAPIGVSRGAVLGRTVTVAQNLIWANQVKGKPTRWTAELIDGDGAEPIGEFDLPARPEPRSKRLPLVAVALGRTALSNVVYANGAWRAETTANQVFEALGPDADISEHPEIAALRELIQKVIHPKYALAETIRRGVAFHYGNMPQLVRHQVEKLFRDGTIQYLICTSTLLEGVNLPCQNIFIQGPERGKGNKMVPADFWNLAGRAGRWGQEFAGNIVCVDTNDQNKWPDPPRQRVRYPLARSVDRVTQNPDALISYIRDGSANQKGEKDPLLEAVFSMLATLRMRDEPLSTAVSGMEETELDRLRSEIDAALVDVSIPLDLVVRHSGISPVSMQTLLSDFERRDDPYELLISPPESDDALNTIVSAFGRIQRTLGGSFGKAGRTFGLGLLVSQWMRGTPLAIIIDKRIDYERRTKTGRKLDAIIRSCMADVEQIARFEAPKYLACYLDLVAIEFERRGLTEDLVDLPDVAMLLELGVARATEVSMMTLGLSRTTAVALAEFNFEDDMSPEQCVEWLRTRDLPSLGLAQLVVAEIEALLSRRDSTL